MCSISARLPPAFVTDLDERYLRPFVYVVVVWISDFWPMEKLAAGRIRGREKPVTCAPLYLLGFRALCGTNR